MRYEWIRYLAGGVLTTLLNIGLFSMLRYAVCLPLLPANILSVLGAIIAAFFVNRFYVFQKTGTSRLIREFLAFSGMRGISMAMEILGMELLTQVCRVPELVSKTGIQFLVIVTNYIISKLFVFRERENQNEKTDSHCTLLQ